MESGQEKSTFAPLQHFPLSENLIFECTMAAVVFPPWDLGSGGCGESLRFGIAVDQTWRHVTRADPFFGQPRIAGAGD